MPFVVGSKPSNIFDPIAFATLSNVYKFGNLTPNMLRFSRSTSIVLYIIQAFDIYKDSKFLKYDWYFVSHKKGT